MFAKNFVRQCAGVAAGAAIVLGSSASTTLAMSAASEASLYQAGRNAGRRLSQEGYTLRTLNGAPYYQAFLRGGTVRNMRVSIPRRGRYVLLVGGDNDTVDLDVVAPQIRGRDVSFGRTAFIDFDVYKPGEFRYSIDMRRCQTSNCGVYAVLLRVGD